MRSGASYYESRIIYPPADSPEKKIGFALQTLSLQLGLLFIPWLPRGVICGLAKVAGRAAYRIDRRGRRVGRANLDVVFGDDKTEVEKEAILRASYRTFSLVGLDMLWFSKRSGPRIDRWMKMDPDDFTRYADGPFVTITGHYGNWEVLGQSLAHMGIGMVSVALPLKNRGVDNILLHMRTRTGQVILPAKGAVRRLLKAIRAGDYPVLLLDQNTSPREGGMWVDYGGLPVPVSPAPAMLSYRTGTDICIGFGTPEPDGTYRARIWKILPAPAREQGNDERIIAELTQQILHEIEAFVRAEPEHWLWMYKRWKLFPPERGGEGYPYYARAMKPRESGVS